MALKFLDLAVGLPHLWGKITAQITAHNNSTTAHNDIRDTINSLSTSIESKVSKESGKGLSTNDYTNAEKTKLNSVETGANKTVVDTELSATSTNPVQNKIVNAAKSEIDNSIQEINDALTAFRATKGENGGLAPLNDSGIIDSAYLPSYVDDVLEFESQSAFPLSDAAETGKIYVDKATNKTYRWSGTGYVEISASLALGTTSATAFRGDYGEVAYTHAFAKGSAFASGLYKITTNDQGHVIAATAVAKADITAMGIPAENTTYSNATTSTAGLMAADDKTKLDGIEAITETEIDAVCGEKIKEE